MFLALGIAAASAGERDVVKPLISDKLISERLTHEEMTGGEIDRRIMELIYRNYMVLDLDRDWLDKFRESHGPRRLSAMCITGSVKSWMRAVCLPNTRTTRKSRNETSTSWIHCGHPATRTDTWGSGT